MKKLRLAQSPEDLGEDFKIVETFPSGRIVERKGRFWVNLLIDGSYMFACSRNSLRRAITAYHDALHLHRYGPQPVKRTDGLKECMMCDYTSVKLTKGLCARCDSTHGRGPIKRRK